MKVGDYVRTKKGTIYQFNSTSSKALSGAKKYMVKSSPNIIDLIEVGDIVNYEQLNGGVVLNKKEDSIDTWSILPNSLKNKDIKSVITKEQLKNNMYIVGE